MTNRALVRSSMAALAFAISIVSFSGLILRDDLTGQLIFGGVWMLVGSWWLGSWLRERRG